MKLTGELVNAALNAAATEAQTVVLEYAATFEKREDYLPLELLAGHIQRRVLEAASEALGIPKETPVQTFRRLGREASA